MEYAVLRWMHLFFGIVWAGAGIGYGLFVIPAAVEAGPGGGAVLRNVAVRKLPQVMTVSGLLSLLAGVRLYQLRFSLDWLSSAEGIVLTLGALFAVGAFAIGLMSLRPAGAALADAGARVAAAGGAPTPEVTAQLEAAQRRLAKVGRLFAVHLAAAAFLMSLMRIAQTM